MENLRKLWLVGPDGKPLDERLRTVFGRLLPKFVKRFPAFRDAADVQNHGEEAVRRFQQKEEQSGQELEKPWGYAWRALESVGLSAERTNEMQVCFRTVETRTDSAIVSRLQAWDDSVERIEQRILLREIEAKLKPRERWILRQKALEHTSAEIAAKLGCSVNAVDQLWGRTRRKIRALADVKE
jgi:DNA-directed RNA polymerase specialized sigma24 family protein